MGALLVWGLPVHVAAVATVLLTAAFANALEYGLHRWPMHRRTSWATLAYERHTLMHHRLFDGPDRDLVVPHHRDWFFILFPPWALPMVILGTAAVGGLVALIAGGAVGRWFAAAGLAYFSLYEALHLAYHLPFSERGVLAWLRAHHARHHQRGTCATHNFNVTVPLFDVLLGTRWRP